MKNLEPSIKNKSLTKVKAKDSDDEDYMAWKKPDVSAPIVTFTPPPDETPGSSFDFKPNVLTKKHLETFNVRQNINIARAVFADGDDGFESLNGYNSNGSDGDRKTEASNEAKSKDIISDKPLTESNEPIDKNVDEGNKVLFGANELKKEDDEKSVEPESDGALPTTSSPSEGKRVGVRFRKSWRNNDDSDNDFTVPKKKEKVII